MKPMYMLQAQLSSSRAELEQTQRDAQEAKQAQQEAQSALDASKEQLADAGRIWCTLEPNHEAPACLLAFPIAASCH